MNSKVIAQRVRTQLLHILNDGQFHSGEELASQFNLSRSAVSNHIKALSALGVDIFSVKGRGYQLSSSIELLDKQKIMSVLKSNKIHIDNASLPDIFVENMVSSTNDVIKQANINQHYLSSGACCIAEAQSAGRGRRGKTWVSPFGSSIYLSMLWRFADGYQAMAGLSLMVGVTLNQTLKDFGLFDCQLKWPNDLYFHGKKLAGILIEVEGQVGAGASAIIGIGLNVNLPSNVVGIDQAYTDLASAFEIQISRNELVSRLIIKLWNNLAVFEQNGLAPFLADWEDADLFKDKGVRLISGSNEIIGTSRGIDMQGALLLEKENRIEAFHGGEISVRALLPSE